MLHCMAQTWHLLLLLLLLLLHMQALLSGHSAAGQVTQAGELHAEPAGRHLST